MSFLHKNDSIYVAGHTGLVGSAILRKLRAEGFTNITTRTSSEVNLRDQQATYSFFQENKFKAVFLAAAKVGGIIANRDQPGLFIAENLQIQTNVIDAANISGVDKLLFLGSSCIYPRDCPQPIKEQYLLTGPLESTNRAYAIAKIAGLEMVQAYAEQYGFGGICAMPTNLYGPNDNFDWRTGHVLPALISKFHNAKGTGETNLCLWGSGTPRREFLHVDDLADACLFMMQNVSDPAPINVGCGTDISIKELADLIAKVVGYEGNISFDPAMPDGTPRKLLDTSVLTGMGWTPTISLEDGIRQTYVWYQDSLLAELLANAQ